MDAPKARFIDDFEFLSPSDGEGKFFEEDVRQWKNRLAVRYRNMTHVQESKVIEMKWYKNTDGLEHEYIVVTCRRDSGGVDIHLRLERRPSGSGEDLITDKTAPSFEFTKGYFWTAIQKLVPKWYTPLLSYDSVTRIDNPEPFPYETPRLIASCHSFQQPFYLRDLAFLADRIVARHPKYQFFVTQCYWLARAVFNVTGARYQPTIDRSPYFATAGTYTPGKGKDGSTGPGIPVNKDSDIDVHKIQTDFEGDLAAHNSQVMARLYRAAFSRGDTEKELREEKRKRQEIEDELKLLMSSPNAAMDALKANPVDNFEFPNPPDGKGRLLGEEVQQCKYHVAVRHDNLTQVQESEVVEMKWYKNIYGLEREYITVTCRDSGGVDIHLRLERRSASSEKANNATLPGEATKAFTEEEQKSYQRDVEMDKHICLCSNDPVTCIDNPGPFPYERSRLIASYHSFQQPFCLRDLVLLVDRVHAHHGPECRFFLGQCYWFARTIFNVAGARYQPTFDRSPHFPTAGTYTPGKGKDGPAEPGIPMNEDSEVDVQKIQMDFEGALAAHISQVMERHSLEAGNRSFPPVIAEDSFQLNSRVSLICAVFSDILGDKVRYRRLLSYRDSDAQRILDLLQSLLDCPQLESNLKRNLLSVLLKLAKGSGLYPQCFALKDVTKEEYPITQGNFGEIWRGNYPGFVVCIKVVKMFQKNDARDRQRLLQAFCREAIIWRHLSHPNVLPFYGIYHLEDSHGRMCLVSPWMENGNVNDYLKQNPGANRSRIASNIICGLSYLHQNDFVHGDLKGGNILITLSGQACLADFGLSTLINNDLPQWTLMPSTANRGGTVRWQSRELIVGSMSPNKESDIYAFACTCYEIFTGKLPFYESRLDANVILKIMQGERPSHPSESLEFGITNSIWSLMEECWQSDPLQRPKAVEVMGQFQCRDDENLDQWQDLSSLQFHSNVKNIFDPILGDDFYDLVSLLKGNNISSEP